MSNGFVDGQTYIGTPCTPKYGKRNGTPVASLAMMVTEGECKGMTVEYKLKKWDQKSLKYGVRDLKAAGWKGKSITTFESDINAAHAAGHTVQFVARLANFEGDTWWTAGSIGYAAPVLDAADADTTKNVDAWLAEAGGGDGNDGHPNAPGADSDIPF